MYLVFIILLIVLGSIQHTLILILKELRNINNKIKFSKFGEVEDWQEL